MKLRRLLMASALALSFVVSAPAVAHADPISAAVVTFFGFTGTAAAVATFVVNSALYAAGTWAIGKAAQALGLVKNAVAERQASVTSLSLGETPREAIIGTACTGGTLVDAWNWGGKYRTDYTTRCIALADHVCESLVGFYVDDQYYAFTGNGVQAGFGGGLQLYFVNASAAGSVAPGAVSPSDGGWGANDRLVGVTHIWVVTFFDDKVWTQGHPRFKFVLRGLKAYDPRRDAALGYAGPNPHVWEDPSTHQWTENAAVLAYNFRRGVYAAGRHGQPEHLLLGRGLTAEEAPPERIIAAANVCDEIAEGGRRYRAGGVISSAQTFIEVEEMFAAAMAGVIVQRDGGVEIEPGQAKAPVVTITDADLVVGETVTFFEFLPDTEGGRINTVVPRYVAPDQGWKDHGGPPRRDPADIIADGGPREMTLPLMLVTNGPQADRCAEIARRRARLERRATIVLPPDYAGVEEGDWIAWQSDRYHGGATVRYQVTSFSLDQRWRMQLSLEEIASSVFGVPDPIEDTAEPPPPPTPVDALELLGVTAEAITLAGEIPLEEGGTAPGTALPAVRFKWGRTYDEEGEVDQEEPADAALVQIRAEIRRVGSTDVASALTDDVSAEAWIVTNGVIPDAVLECRLTPIASSPTRPVLPSAWMTVTTGAVTAGIPSDHPIWGELQQNAKDLLQNNIDDAQALLEEEQKRDLAVNDVLDRLGLGFVLDPVERSAIIKEETIADGVGPGGLPETLVQMSTRLVAADAANTAAVAQALINAKAYADTVAANAVIGLATVVQMNNAIAASALNLQGYTDSKVATATANLVSASQLATAITNSELSLQTWTNGQISTAVANLVSASQLATSLATAKGQWESYATAAAASAIVGLDTVAAREAALATARGQWESYADDAAAEATIGLDTVAQREAAVAASALALQSWTNGQITDATATLASQSALNGVSASAALALSTAVNAQGVANAIIGLTQDVNGLISGLVSQNNGSVADIAILSTVFRLIKPGGGARAEFIDGVWYFVDAEETTRCQVGKPFGANGNLVLWCGPSSVAVGSESKANAYVYVATNTVNGPRFGGNDAPGTLNYTIANRQNFRLVSTTGTFTTQTTTTITVTGGSGDYNYEYVLMSQNSDATGHSNLRPTSNGGAGANSTAWTGTITQAGETITASCIVEVRDNQSGKTLSVPITGRITHTA